MHTPWNVMKGHKNHKKEGEFLSLLYSLFCSLSVLNIGRAALVCVKENILLNCFLSWPLVLEIIYPGFLKYVDFRKRLMELSPMLLSYVSFLYNISSYTNLIANKIGIYLFSPLEPYFFNLFFSHILLSDHSFPPSTLQAPPLSNVLSSHRSTLLPFPLLQIKNRLPKDINITA